MTVLCSWCRAVLQAGPAQAPVSHGCCEPCWHRVRAESGLKAKAYPVAA